MNSIRAFAPAKVNLGLEVLRHRSDGFHDIESIFQTLDFGDELEFSKSPDSNELRISLAEGELEDGPKNSIRLAWELLTRLRPDKVAGVRVKLWKRIPLGGGLGGGSSDAAATLMALNRLYRLQLSPEELERAALELGSDVPFFLKGGTAIVRGRGERLQSLVPLSGGAFLLVFPDLSISTAWAYEHLRLGLTGNPYRISVEQVKGYLSRFPISGMVLKNRLEDVVFPAYPIFDEITEALRAAGAVHAIMSGSGSTVFGTFPDAQAAEVAATALEGKWRTHIAGPRVQGIGLD
jgi:4-diphosphocytidyl-2-C-methyl-D-erythritol kinase